MSEYVTRRDFLKLLGVGLGVVAGGAACGPTIRSPEGQLPRHTFDKEAIIFNGKFTSINEIGLEATAYYSTVQEQLIKVLKGDMSGVTTPGTHTGTKGLDADWVLDPLKTAISINRTEDGNFIAHAVVGRKRVGEIPLLGEGGSAIVNSFWSAGAYNEHSLLVVGGGGKPLWFDNVESNNENGRTRLVVDGNKGKVYQITNNKQNFVQSFLSGEENGMIVSELNAVKGSKEFAAVSTPASEGFIGLMKRFINKLPPTMTPEEKLESAEYFFTGITLNSQDVNYLVQLFGDGEDVRRIANSIARIRVDVPFDSRELSFVNSVLAQNLRNSLSGIEPADNENDAVRGILPGGVNVETGMGVIEDLVNERVSLPVATPEVYFVKVKDESENEKWYAVGRYPVWENDVDRTVISNQSNAYSVRNAWFTYGEVSEPDIVDNPSLRPYEKVVEGFPFDDVKKIDSNSNKPLNWELFGGNNTLVEVRKVGAEAMKFGWDPAEADPKHKINTGFFVSDSEGYARFLKLTLDEVDGNNIHNLPMVSNRMPLPFMGNSPRVIKDVTDDVNRLISKGHTTTSPFGLDEYASYSLLANSHSGPEGYLNYDFMNTNMTAKALESMVPPGAFVQGAADNSMLIYSESSLGGQVNILVFDAENNQVGTIPVTHPVIVSPYSVGELDNGARYITIAQDSEAKLKYAVMEEDVFPLGARSTAKLAGIGLGEAAIAIAVLYGGYQLLAHLPVTGHLLKGALGRIAGAFVH